MVQSILSDQMLRDLIAAGQVDVLVGVPTFNNAATVEAAIRAVHLGFARHFPRERTLLINSDGGSDDGTREIVHNAAVGDPETFVATHSLRTVHRISAPYHGLPGKGNAVRAIFAAADLLQAKAVAVLDPDVTSIAPDWIDRLIRPVLKESLDFVAPVYPRHPFDGLLVSQLIRPLVRATYGQRLREPIGGEFACSGRFIAHCLAQEVWDSDFARVGIDPWLAGTAMAEGFRVGQAHLGPHLLASAQARPGLTETVQQVVGALFDCLAMHQACWQARQGSEEVPTFGIAVAPEGESPSLDATTMAHSFASGVRDLEPILGEILGSELRAEVLGLAKLEPQRFAFPDRLWVATVYEFAAAHRHAAMHREHLLQALVPLYLGRVASFVAAHATASAAVVDQHLEQLGLEYERAKPRLIELWSSERGR